MSRGFELPPQTVEEQERRLAELELREELRELELEDRDHELERASVGWWLA